MKVLVIGGSGLIGSRVVSMLDELGHSAVSASPRSGVNAVTGDGVAEAMAGVDAVVDVTNAPSWADDDVMQFFTISTTNLLAAEQTAGVKHHLALSIVGNDRVPDSGYMRAKTAQEKIIEDSSVPYSIVRATQFFEFVIGIADSATEGNTVRLPHAAFQPIWAEDVSAAVARMTIGRPLYGITNIAGPEKLGMDDFARTALAAYGDPRQVVTDPTAPYYGAVLDDRSLVPVDGEAVTICPTRFSDWLTAHAPSAT